MSAVAPEAPLAPSERVRRYSRVLVREMWASLVDTHVNGVARLLADRLAQLCLHGQPVRAVALRISAPSNGSPSIAPRIFTALRSSGVKSSRQRDGDAGAAEVDERHQRVG